jgi:hypothetical protein
MNSRSSRINAELALEGVLGRPGWWWLSFADPDREPGSEFLGVVIVEARGFALAVRRTHELGINPGGEVQFEELPDAPQGHWLPYCDRLLAHEEAQAVPVP